MTVLVTGASGRIGHHVTARLLDQGRAVRALVRPGDPRRDRVDRPGVELVDGDLADAESLRRAVDGVDAVIHLAAALSSRGHAEDDFVPGNVVGTYALLTALRDRRQPLERLVYISSDAVYWAGQTVPPCFLPVDESHPRQPGSVYGASKLAAEELCLTFWRLHGIPATIVRPTATADAEELLEPDGVFGKRMFVGPAIRALEANADPGPAERELLAALRAVDTGRPQLFVVADADGRTAMSTLNDARDGAAGIILAMDSPLAVGEAFNIGPAAGYAETELIGSLGERLGVPVVTVRSSRARPSWVVSSAKARAVLGYRPEHSVFDMLDEAIATRGGDR